MPPTKTQVLRAVVDHFVKIKINKSNELLNFAGSGANG